MSMRSRSLIIRDESGATAFEYALIVGSVALSLVIAVKFLGGEVINLYDDVAGAFDINLPGTLGDGASGAGGSNDPPRCVQVGSNCKK